MMFTEHPSIKEWVVIDERSAAFFALGIAKQSRRAVAIVCTSGTAAANYFPAVVEAYHSRVPLIVLTADRPHELRDIGAPQAIDQIIWRVREMVSRNGAAGSFSNYAHVCTKSGSSGSAQCDGGKSGSCSP